MSNSPPPPLPGLINGVESCQASAMQSAKTAIWSFTPKPRSDAFCKKWQSQCNLFSCCHCGKETKIDATCLKLARGGSSHNKLKTVCPSGIVVLFSTILITGVRSRKTTKSVQGREVLVQLVFYSERRETGRVSLDTEGERKFSHETSGALNR